MKKVSAEEKRERLLSVFHDKFDFYNLKEIEKLGTKKGIAGPLIKDVLQQLLDEDLINCEKIGGKNFYYSFPITLQKQNLKKKLQIENKKLKIQIEDLKNNLNSENQNRKLDLNEYYELIEKKNYFEKKLENNFDINDYKSMINEINQYIKDINCVTDNIFCIQSYVINKFNIDRSEFNKSFGVDDEMDYFEE